MADKKWYEVESEQVEEEIQRLVGIVNDLKDDYKRVNKHRHEHKKGLQDVHTRYQSVDSHIDALGRILKDRLKDIKEFKQAVHSKCFRLATLEMYMDIEHDLRVDAERSIRETIEELETGRRPNV